MPKILVLGIGSPFQDDQLGWVVIKRLQESSRLQTFSSLQLQLKCVDRPGLQLLNLMQDAHIVFLIDALKLGSPIGSLHCLEADILESQDWVCNVPSSHAIGIVEALQIGRALDLLPAEFLLYGIEIGMIASQHFNLSPVIADAIEELVRQLEQDVLDKISRSH